MRLIDAATAHYKGLGLQSMEVPEWIVGDRPVTVYWHPMTLDDRNKIVAHGEADINAIVDLLVFKLVDIKGEKLFDLGDKPLLRRAVSDAVLMRVAHRVLRGPTAEEAEKNSPAILN